MHGDPRTFTGWALARSSPRLGPGDHLRAEALDRVGVGLAGKRGEDALDTGVSERAEVFEDPRRPVELAAARRGDGEPREAFDLVEVPAGVVAVAAEDVHLVAELLGVGGALVGRVGVLGDETE